MSMNTSGSGHSAGDAEMLEATSEDQELALGKVSSFIEFNLSSTSVFCFCFQLQKIVQKTFCFSFVAWNTNSIAYLCVYIHFIVMDVALSKS